MVPTSYHEITFVEAWGVDGQLENAMNLDIEARKSESFCFQAFAMSSLSEI